MKSCGRMQQMMKGSRGSEVQMTSRMSSIVVVLSFSACGVRCEGWVDEGERTGRRTAMRCASHALAGRSTVLGVMWL
jgi:hypothetical protein